MSRHCKLSPEEAESCYQDYCRWLEADRLWHPKKLAAKYGIATSSVHRYGRRKHKRRAA